MTYPVFLSHNSLDKTEVEHLARELLRRGIRPWLDKWDLTPGRPWQAEIEQAIRGASAVLVCLGRHGLGRVQNPELEVAQDRAWRDPTRLVIPVLLASAPENVEVPDFLRQRSWVDLRGEEAEAAFERLVAALEGQDLRPADTVASGPPGVAPDSTTGSRPVKPDDSNEAPNLGQVFISYRHVPADTRLAKALDSRLRNLGLKVFLDQRIEVGTRWVEVIDRAIRESSYFVPILSHDSIRSDMVRKEVALAHQFEREGTMRILPIRAITLRRQLPYDLAACLDPIQYALWDSEGDEDSLCWVIASAILGSSLPESAETSDVLQDLGGGSTEDEAAPMPAADPRLVLEQGSEGGAVRLSSPFYVERDADRRMEVALRRKGTTLVVKGMRQSGKSSLLARSIALARSQGRLTVYLDFQTLEDAQLESCSKLLYTLAHRIHSALRTSLRPKEVWDEDIGSKQSFAEFLERAILETIDEPVLLALDEVDRIFTRPYRADFFATVRSWHSNRAIYEELWSKLDLAIAHATDPTLWIDDLNQSPFNVGERLRLEGFSLDEVSDLNRRYGSPLRSPSEVEQLLALVGGQPYLVRQALWALVANSWSLAELRRVAFDDDGPFGDHLRYHLWVLHNNPRLETVVRGLTQRQGCQEELDFQRLLAAGLLRGETREQATLLCELYEQYFRSHL